MENKEVNTLIDDIEKQHADLKSRINCVLDGLQVLRDKIKRDRIKFDADMKAIDDKIKKEE